MRERARTERSPGARELLRGAMPFDRNEEGDLVAGEAQDRQSAGAESAARRMTETAAGAAAFSRTGDPSTGEFKDAVVLRQLSEVPSNVLRGE